MADRFAADLHLFAGWARPGCLSRDGGPVCRRPAPIPGLSPARLPGWLARSGRPWA